VSPLLSISVGTLEKLMGALNTRSLDLILEDRLQRNPTLLWPFDAASKFVHRGMPANTPRHMDVLNDIMSQTVRNFGVTDPPAFADTTPGK
jgi:hypothetical protein